MSTRAGQRLGGLVYGGQARLDVTLHAAQRLVAGLGHDHVGRGGGLAQVGGRRMAQGEKTGSAARSNNLILAAGKRVLPAVS
jgi:hypothetical protein